MRILRILGVTALGLFVLTDTAQSQRGGAVRSGAGPWSVTWWAGAKGAATGAKIGVVTGATPQRH